MRGATVLEVLESATRPCVFGGMSSCGPRRPGDGLAMHFAARVKKQPCRGLHNLQNRGTLNLGSRADSPWHHQLTTAPWLKSHPYRQ